MVILAKTNSWKSMTLWLTPKHTLITLTSMSTARTMNSATTTSPKKSNNKKTKEIPIKKGDRFYDKRKQTNLKGLRSQRLFTP